MRRGALQVLFGRAALAAWSFCGLAGCGGEATRGDGGVAVADSAGVERVHNAGVGVWGGAAPRVEEVVRLGVVDGEEAYQFHGIYSLAVDAEGTIYVGNNQTASVRVFSAAGRFEREMGRRGRGPGEYREVNRVWLTHDGVAVTDWSGMRTGVYDRAGRLLAFWSALRPDGTIVLPVAQTPAGWVASREPRAAPQPGLAQGTRIEQPRRLHHFDPDGDTVGAARYELPPRVLYASPATHGADWALFDPPEAAEFDGAGRLFIARGETYRIDVYDVDGRHLRGITRDWEPTPIRDADIERIKAGVAAAFEARHPGASAADRDREVARIDLQRSFNPRPHLPPLGRLLVAPDGSFWVERADAADPVVLGAEAVLGVHGGGERRSHWDLFDTAGRFLTSVTLAPRFRPHAARGTEVTGVLQDEFDVEYVVTYRVTPGG